MKTTFDLTSTTKTVSCLFHDQNGIKSCEISIAKGNDYQMFVRNRSESSGTTITIGLDKLLEDEVLMFKYNITANNGIRLVIVQGSEFVSAQKSGTLLAAAISSSVMVVAIIVTVMVLIVIIFYFMVRFCMVSILAIYFH